MKILTFGCFNIIHPGHIDLFRLSKILDPTGELVVAIAADKIVRDAKDTVKYSMRDKLNMISAIEYVDRVDIYGQEICESELESAKTYQQHLQLVQPAELEVVRTHNPDFITFGADKDATTYTHIAVWAANHNRHIRFVQLPRLDAENMNSSTIIQNT